MAPREKNLDKAAKEAKVKARREAARAADLADNVSDQDLAKLEDDFWEATGVQGGTRLRLAGMAGSGGGSGYSGRRGGEAEGVREDEGSGGGEGA